MKQNYKVGNTLTIGGLDVEITKVHYNYAKAQYEIDGIVRLNIAGDGPNAEVYVTQDGQEIPL